MRSIWVLSLVACGGAEGVPALPEAVSPPPSLVLNAREFVQPGQPATFDVSGAADGEPVYLIFSVGSGPPACPRFLGGACMGIPSPATRLQTVAAAPDGTASFVVNVPPGVMIGSAASFQAVLIRGRRGVASVLSNVHTVEVVDGVPGCTAPNALNYDAAATVDDGSCQIVPATAPGYAGPAGPDRSSEGYILCSGTASGLTDSAAFFGPCAGATEVAFACSADANATAEYLSAGVPGADFLDGVCDDFVGGAVSPFGNGHILSLDDGDPGCGVYNVSYDLYMDMENGQWGCGGTANTNGTGGRMWMYARDPRYVPGCTDEDAGNYNPVATVDDGTCFAAGRALPTFTGVFGPDLSADGFFQCAGTDDGNTTSVEFYGACAGYSEIRFGCSTGPDEVAEYLSPVIPVSTSALTDGTCDDFGVGASSPFGPGHILSLDGSNPACADYNVIYDMYMDMVNGQWGCAGSANTHATGGRMWAWVR